MKKLLRSTVKRLLAILAVCVLVSAGFPLSFGIAAYAEEVNAPLQCSIGEAVSKDAPGEMEPADEGADPEGSDPEGTVSEGLDPEGADSAGSDPEGADPEGSVPEGADLEAALVPLGANGATAPVDPLATGNIRLTGTESYDYAYQVLTLVNQERAKLGRGALTMNATLSEAAMQRAAELAVFFDHIRPNGLHWSTVTPYLATIASSENIAIGYTSPTAVMSNVNGWMSSQGHRDNILNSSWSSMGVGVFVHNGTAYWVQLFCTATSATPAQPSNVTNSRVVALNSATCVFPSAAIISDSSIVAGQTKSYQLRLTNADAGVSSWAFCLPDMDYGITYSSSNTLCLQVLAGTMRGLAAGSANLSAGVAGFITVTKLITVTAANTAPGITGPTTMTLTQGYAATSSAVFTATGNPAPTVSKTSGHASITWNNTTKKLDIAAGLTPGSYSVVLTATNGVTPNATITFTLTVNPNTTPVAPGVTYRTHVQNIGDQAAVSNGDVSGTSGRSLRLEGIWISLTGTYSGNVIYSTHVQSIGWQNEVQNGAMSGTAGRSLRLEGITIRLSGDISTKYDIYYRVHAQNVGWMGWAKNGEMAGTAGHSLRLEAIQIVLVAKGDPAPAISYKGVSTVAGTPRMIDPGIVTSGLGYSAVVHIQNIGDRSYPSADGSTILGTSGQSLRLEAMTLKLRGAPLSGGISYETHIQNIGWQGVRSDGQVAGTAGLSLRLEAIRITLTGEMGKYYDVYYRTHIQNFGWTGWAKNGQSCGSAGYSYRMEAMQIVIVPKGGAAPGLNSGYFYQR